MDKKRTGTSRRTWGRELSAALLVFLMYMGYQGRVAELEVLALPFVTFAIYAFGSRSLRDNPDRISTIFGNNTNIVDKYPEEDLREK